MWSVERGSYCGGNCVCVYLRFLCMKCSQWQRAPRVLRQFKLSAGGNVQTVRHKHPHTHAVLCTHTEQHYSYYSSISLTSHTNVRIPIGIVCVCAVFFFALLSFSISGPDRGSRFYCDFFFFYSCCLSLPLLLFRSCPCRLYVLIALPPPSYTDGICCRHCRHCYGSGCFSFRFWYIHTTRHTHAPYTDCLLLFVIVAVLG